ncbi:36.4 kDa proline-rich protein-like [Dioscorea cayenensis subsp. rotundata]|uniref:36.4 kDa proline-rich protein-like n=1 Tax=Dioscorea cayennensis subsp. rotundata TaxID=55577 RepID=A0AB40AIH0_DIOCR|nr:36.4 kDa proline-rich protein-like [Dioscorea cayenensis subsp. rotundata]
MESLTKTSLSLFLFILFLTFSFLIPSQACPVCQTSPPPPPPPKKIPPPPPPKPVPCPPPPKPSPPPPPPPKPSPPPPPPPTPSPPPPPPPKPVPSPPPPKPKPVPCPPPPKSPAGTCPIDVLKLDACVDLLGGLINIGIGNDTKKTCCPVLSGLVDLDAAICLCTTIKAKLLNINILLPIALQLLVDCEKHAPEGFQCPA